MSETAKRAAWLSPPDRSVVARDLTVLVLALAVSFLVAGPSGNFPLNDDWSFAAAVRSILDDGTFRPTEWTAMTLLMHTLWGSAFSAIAGYSFDTLRFSTQVLAFAAVAVCYLLARELALPRWLCVMTAAMLASTPLFFALSASFMTDVPFMAATLATAFFLIRALNVPTPRNFGIAIIFTLIAILTRQLAIALPLAFAVIYPLLNRGSARKWLTGVVPLVLGIAAFAGYRIWLGGDGRLPAVNDRQAMWLLNSLADPATIGVVLRNFYVASVYLGWFALPLSIAIIFASDVRLRRSLRHAVFGSGLIVALLSLLTRARDGSWQVLMPTSENILVPSGFGAPLLRDQYLLRLDNIPPLPNPFWPLVTVLGLIGATLLLALLVTATTALVQRWRRRDWSCGDGAAAFLLVTVAVYLFPLLATAFFDRYLLPALPLLAIAIATAMLPAVPRMPSLPSLVASTVLMIAFAAFSIAGTHDFLAWNRLRWQMLDNLMQQRQLTAADIDGGFEFNGLLNYRDDYVRVEGKSQWWVDGDDWMIGYGPIPGYDIVERRSYRHWLPSNGELVVMRKQVSNTSR